MATSEELEARVAALERLVQELKLEKVAKVLAGSKKSTRHTRRVREYTREERAAIRARLLAGQEAARKRREGEAKANTKAKPSRTEKANVVEHGKA